MIDLDYNEIGKNIRKYRQAKGLKQKDLAESINMSEQHICHIETACTKLSLPTLVAIANVLEVDCNTLLGATFTGAKGIILYEQIGVYLSQMDHEKLKFCVEFCKLLTGHEACYV